MPDREWYRFTAALGIAVVVALAGYLAFAGIEETSTTSPDKALIHRNVLDDPDVPRLTLTATRANYGKDLFGDIQASTQVFYQQSTGAPIQQVSITLDRAWRRIIHTQNFALLKAWGDGDADPRKNLRIALALVANTGYWPLHDNVIQLFIAETGPPRILRVWYHYAPQEMGFGDSLSFASDSLEFPCDLDIDDNGTAGNWYDDTLWVLDDYPAAPRLVRYCPYCDPSGKTGSIDIPYGSGTGQMDHPLRIAMGRDLSGANTKEIYVIDRWGKIVQYRISGDALIYENEYRCGWSGGQREEIVEPVDVTVDGYGQVYVSAQITTSRIYKFTPDLELLCVFRREGKGPEEIWNPYCLHNSRRTVDYAGFDNLLVSEDWTLESGGQRYAIGVKDSVISTFFAPHSADLSYHATDPHGLTLKIEKWTGSAWAAFDTVPYGFRFSGTTEASWELPAGEWGYDHQYRLRFITKSTYLPVPGSGGVPFADTMTFQVTMGNEKPTILVPLSVAGLQGGCIMQSLPHMASVSAQDDDTPGGLTYTWRDLGGRAQFYNPVTYSYVSTLIGPWSSVDLLVSGGAVSLAGSLPPVDLSVTITDAGGGSIATDKLYGVCPYGGPCNCSPPCDCPSQGDVNPDGFIDVFDVIQEIAIAFSGGADITDPGCPTSRGDVNNDTVVDVLDVIKIVAVAFGTDSVCNPCTPGVPAGCP